MTIQEEIQGLIQLQKIDNRLREIEEKREDLRVAIEKVRDPLTELEARRDDLIKQVTDLGDEMRRLELTTQELGDRIVKSEEKLPLITTQKEYFALQKEIEIMQRDKSEAEDELLQKMGTYEEQQKEKDELLAQCEAEEKDFHTKKDQMESANTEFDAETQQLDSGKKSVASEIGAQYLQHYKNVLIYKGAPVVVKIIDGNCQGCHMNLPPQLFNDVRKADSIITCSYCNRILYVES